MPQNDWTASSEALPVDGVQVYCYVPTKQTRRHEPEIYRMTIIDGHWIPDDFDWLQELYFPLEAVRWWMVPETAPEFDDVRWLDASVNPTENQDIWIWNDNRKQVIQYWCEGEGGKTAVENCLYYGAAGDPMLHREYVTKWMPCLHPEHIENHFADRFDNSERRKDRQLPAYTAAFDSAARAGNNRLWFRIKQLKLDLPDAR